MAQILSAARRVTCTTAGRTGKANCVGTLKLFNNSKVKGNTDTSGLVSGLVTIRLGDCGAKFKNVGNLKAILISSLYAYPEANLYQSAMHPDGLQFTIPNPYLNSVRIS